LAGPETEGIRTVLHGWRTAVSLPSLSDSRTDCQCV